MSAVRNGRLACGSIESHNAEAGRPPARFAPLVGQPKLGHNQPVSGRLFPKY